MHKVENKKARCLNIPEMIQGCPEISSDFCISLINTLKTSA